MPVLSKLLKVSVCNEEKMTQTERRLYLISELLKEDKGSSAFNFGLVSKNEGGFVILMKKKYSVICCDL